MSNDVFIAGGLGAFTALVATWLDRLARSREAERLTVEQFAWEMTASVTRLLFGAREVYSNIHGGVLGSLGVTTPAAVSSFTSWLSTAGIDLIPPHSFIKARSNRYPAVLAAADEVLNISHRIVGETSGSLPSDVPVFATVERDLNDVVVQMRAAVINDVVGSRWLRWWRRRRTTRGAA